MIIKQSHQKQNNPDGFVLPLVITVGLIMLAGSAAMLARSFGGLVGSTRLEQSRQAKAIAEAGVARTIEGLNRNYNYLLINCYSQSGSAPPPNDCINTGTWGTASLPSSICPDATQNGTPALTATNTNPTGDYVVDYYAYSGTQFYGGTGRLRVIGYRKSADQSRILASAAVEVSFDVKPKPCNCRFGDFSGECSSSGFPGLLGSYINLGNNDVKGATSGNVLCTRCTNPNPNGPPTQAQAEAAIGALNNSDVDGQIFLGPIDLPPVPTPPDLGFDPPEDLNSSITLSGGDNTGPCRTEYEADGTTPKETHCVVNNISMSGAKKIITVDSSAAPVRLYVQGSSLSLTGGAAIEHIPETSNSARLSIFGNPIDPTDAVPDQDVDIAGAATANKMWIYFPDGNVGINGGSKGTPECDVDGECTGGDIHGAVWAKTWNGSNSKNAQLVVPKDMGSQLFTGLGTRFGISVQDYIALGMNSWSSFQKL